MKNLDLNKLDLGGFKYSTTTISKMGSVFYDDPDNEDNWIELFPIHNKPELIGVNYVYTAGTIRSCVFEKDESVVVNIKSNIPEELMDVLNTVQESDS